MGCRTYFRKTFLFKYVLYKMNVNKRRSADRLHFFIFFFQEQCIKKMNYEEKYELQFWTSRPCIILIQGLHHIQSRDPQQTCPTAQIASVLGQWVVNRLKTPPSPQNKHQSSTTKTKFRFCERILRFSTNKNQKSSVSLSFPAEHK